MIRALVRCDDAIVPTELDRGSWPAQKAIYARGPGVNLNLRAQSLESTVITKVEDRAADLVRIAAYVYAADQELSRGGAADVYGRDWRRHIVMCIPVTDPLFWMSDPIRGRLAAVLTFLTEDEWEFYFSAAGPEEHQLPLEVNPRPVLGEPDTVLLFSGGADSLCALVEAIAAGGARPVIVSHRPSPLVSRRQTALLRELRLRFSKWALPHLSFWIHRRGADALDTSQRS